MLSFIKISGLFSPNSTHEATPRRRISLALESLESRDLMSAVVGKPIPPVKPPPGSVPPPHVIPPGRVPPSHP
jgi:hypothetical protein